MSMTVFKIENIKKLGGLTMRTELLFIEFQLFLDGFVNEGNRNKRERVDIERICCQSRRECISIL